MIAALILVLTGCGSSAGGVDGPSADAELPFPHAAAYDAGLQHGAEARTYGVATCLSCHLESETAAPTCASCHAIYPHTEGWLAGTVHGAELAGNAGIEGRAACQTCHGVEGLAAPSCTSCHGSYPHAEDWGSAGKHGTWSLARGSAEAACGSCHGADLTGVGIAPSCTTCHSTYPHPAGWSDPAVHPLADLSTCAGCHGEDGSGGTANVSCARCHAGYPHGDTWLVDHMGAVDKSGEAACLACHSPGDGTATMPAACGATCHGGTP